MNTYLTQERYLKKLSFSIVMLSVLMSILNVNSAVIICKQGQGNQCRTPGVKFEDKLEETGK